MAVSLKASKAGLEIVDAARRKKGWTKTAAAWSDKALVGKAGLRRFWRRIPITQENFVRICQAVGVENWQEIVDDTAPASAPTSASNDQLEYQWEIQLQATIEDTVKEEIDQLVFRIQQLSANVMLKQQKIDLAAAEVAQNWQPETAVRSPSRQSRSRSAKGILPEGTITRAKEIDLGGGEKVVLVAQLTPETESEVGAIVDVEPAEDARYLPAGLQVAILDESDEIVLEDSAGEVDDSMRFEFGMEPGELFAIRVSLGDVTIAQEL
jgi:hypothetical protein